MRHRLLIIDSDSAHTDALSVYLSGYPQFQIVGIANTGIQAQTLLSSVKADIVLMDPVLPGLDGLCLLKLIRKMKRRPVVICQSDFCSSASLEAVMRNGASYFLFKQIPFGAIATNLIEYAELAANSRKQQEDEIALAACSKPKARIHEVMHRMGFSMKYSGSRCIAESICILLSSPMMIHNMSTGLYPELSAHMNLSPECVERNIRTAISMANANGRLNTMIGRTPTNKSCIQYILRQVNSTN